MSLQRRIVHLDLKGAPPKPSVYPELFALFRQLNFTTVLMEYEDYFPYKGNLSILRATHCYSEDDVKEILALAHQNDLEVIPLMQTFGHLEFVLKHPQFAELREVSHKADTICPSDPRSLVLIREMMTQMRYLHPNVTTLHIGADEAWHIAQDERCQSRVGLELSNSTARLKLDHISRVANIAKAELNFEEVLAWNDMFADIEVPLLKEYRLGELVTPVVWGYAVDVTRPGYFPDGMFERFLIA
ncbi:Protein HEX-4 [Aphelenchoides avenae]|nr:Protein HEX-4 [Aphelenchus avenae]